MASGHPESLAHPRAAIPSHGTAPGLWEHWDSNGAPEELGADVGCSLLGIAASGLPAAVLRRGRRSTRN